MSKFHIQEGKGARHGTTLYQVFLGGKAIGDPFPSREQAEAYIKHLEEMEELDQDGPSL
ncbi:SPOR domain-containing protein [Aquipseudomonas alcaligenes]|uniref:SPOR domain-containing protein n=1 Tax=Aquipseudomonas alcaligenes TaxID=43263 RepID=UPI000B22BB0A|nr:hypothetical protein [Pseudomonas alcaligenes]